MRHRPRRRSPRARLARAARPGARRSRRGRPPRRLGRGRGHGRRRRSAPPAEPGRSPGMPGAGLAMCFLREGWLRSAVEDACRAEGLQPAGWREVPTRTAALGVTALASLPRIEQLVLAPSEHPDAERRAYRARRTRRARSRRLRRLALVPDGHVQGAVRGRAAGALLPRPRRIRRSRCPSRSSTSASRRTRSRAGSARSRSGCSATTARSTRSTGT